jgi:2'-5' RNA ligase
VHALRTGLVIEVPEAEQAVGALRLHLDPQARLGVPPHITVLFPFAAPSRIDDATLDRVASAVRDVRVFDYRLIRTDWFGADMLWLAPDDKAPFRALTSLLNDEFPEYPPYGGQFSEVEPHLTIGNHGSLAELRAAEQSVQEHLPISATARQVSLFAEQASGRWLRQAVFALAT